MRIDAAQTVQFPSEYLDGFGHPIFSGYYTLADLTHKYGVDSSIYTTTVNGANAAVSKYANFDAVKLDTGSGTSGAYAQIQTKRYYRYQAGKANLLRMTFALDSAPGAGFKAEVGLFDASDGLFSA